MSLSPSVLLGNQRPRWAHVPSGGVSSAAVEALELAEYAGLTPLDWQRWYAHESMQQRRDGLWLTLEDYLEIARQNGKGGALEIDQLAGLFLLPVELAIHTAHEFKTAYEHFRRLVDLCDGRDDLRKRVKRVRTGAGDQAIEMLNGNRIRFMARSSSSGRGFSADKLYLDEAQHLTFAMLGAMLPAMSARANPKLIVAGSAPLETSEVSHNYRRRVMAGDEARLFGAVWGNDEGADPDDPEVVAAANPSLGVLIDHEFVEGERRAMAPAEFARERLGVAAYPKSDKAAVKLTLDAWSACGVPTGDWSGARVADGQPVVLAVSAPSDRSHASLVMAGFRADGLVHVEDLSFDESGVRYEGVAWLKVALPRIVKAWGHLAVIVVDPKDPAASVVADVEASLGEKVRRVSLERFAASCVDFVDRVHEQSVKHRGEFVFSESVAGLRVRSIGDGGLWVWCRSTSKSDPSPVIAATLAVGELPGVAASAPAKREFFVY